MENQPLTTFGKALELAKSLTDVTPNPIGATSVSTSMPAGMPQASGGPRPFPKMVNTNLAQAASAPAMTFGTEHYARQEAYGDEVFADLGFNILRDNEEYYNANTGWTQDFNRMRKHWMPGAIDGFTSSYHGLQSMFEGNSLNALALAKAKGRASEEAAGLAMSTRGGLGQSLVNIPYNLNYVAGLTAELVVEDLALAALIPETGGTSGAVAIGRTAVGVGKIAKSLMTLTKNAATLRRAETLRSLYNLGEVSKAAAMGAARNLYSGTLPGVAGITRQVQAGRSFTQIAKNASTYVDFYRQARAFGLAIDESALEASGSYNGVYNILYNDFAAQNGRPPTTEEQESMAAQAEKAAIADYFPNLAVVYLTNGITFGNMTTSRALAKSYNTILKNTAGRVVTKQVGNKVTSSIYEKGIKGTLSAAKDIGFKRLALKAAQGTGSYFKANFAEGAQELFQEGLAQGVEDYYTRNYYDSSYTGMLAGLSSAKRGAASQISQNGLEAFLGGFLGGGIVNVASKGLRGASSRLYSQFTPEAYEQKLAEDAADLNAVNEFINEVGQDPMKLFAPELQNLRDQAAANKAFVVASELGDNKAFEDIKDRSMFNHIRKLYLTNSFPAFEAAILDHKNLTPEEKMELFSTETAEEADQLIDNIANRASRIKKNFDYAEGKYRNPIVMADYKRGTEEYKSAVIQHYAWQKAVEDFVFGLDGFERTAERLGQIYNSAKEDNVVAGMSNSDFSVLFNYEGSASSSTAAFDVTLEKEIESNLVEIANLKDRIKQQEEQAATAEKDDAARLKREAENNGKKVAELTRRAEKLTAYQKALENYLNNNEGEQEGEIFTELREKLFDAVNDYLSFLAEGKRQPLDANKVATLVEKIRDYYAVGSDNINFRNAVTTLSDPSNLNKLSKIHQQNLQKVFDYFMFNTEMVKSMLINQKEKNRLITELQEIGVMMSPESLGKFITDDVLPTEFFSEKDSDADGVLIMDSETGKKVTEILKNYQFVQEEAQAEEAPAAKETTTSDIEAKKADIERRRQEELDKYAYDIVERVEDYEVINDQGDTLFVQVRHKKDGSKQVLTGTEKNKYGNVIGAFVSDTFYEDIYQKVTKTGERTAEEANINGRANKINAKYDAELAALEEAAQPKEERTTDEQAVVEVTPEQRVEEEKKEKAKTKEAKKAKYQAKDIQKELPSTYQELLTLLSAYNADMKANGAQPINIQSFINTNKAAQDLIEKAYKNKAEAAKKRASSKEIDKFKARLEKAKSLEEFDDIVNLEGGNFNMKEYESINVPKLRNQLMEKLGQTSVASTEISDENRQQMEDVQAAAEKQQAANAKKLSDILAEDNSDVTDEDIDNIFC